jgi:hypothetical protein
LDLKVGRFHVVEVLLHLRLSDWEWYQSSHQAIEEELLSLLDQSVLPRMFGEEIESYHRKHNPRLFPPEEVGAKNKDKTAKKNSHQNVKNSRKGATTAAEVSKKKMENTCVEEKKPKDVYYAFGEMLQLAYRKQEMHAWNLVGSTIFFKEKLDEEDAEFHDQPKLSGRLLVWCSKVDRQNRTNPDPDNLGFFRQEMIPISALFREPRDLE